MGRNEGGPGPAPLVPRPFEILVESRRRFLVDASLSFAFFALFNVVNSSLPEFTDGTPVATPIRGSDEFRFPANRHESAAGTGATLGTIIHIARLTGECTFLEGLDLGANRGRDLREGSKSEVTRSRRSSSVPPRRRRVNTSRAEQRRVHRRMRLLFTFFSPKRTCTAYFSQRQPRAHPPHATAFEPPRLAPNALEERARLRIARRELRAGERLPLVIVAKEGRRELGEELGGRSRGVVAAAHAAAAEERGDAFVEVSRPTLFTLDATACGTRNVRVPPHGAEYPRSAPRRRRDPSSENPRVAPRFDAATRSVVTTQI